MSKETSYFAFSLREVPDPMAASQWISGIIAAESYSAACAILPNYCYNKNGILDIHISLLQDKSDVLFLSQETLGVVAKDANHIYGAMAINEQETIR